MSEGGDRVALAAGALRAELWPAVGGSLGAFYAGTGGGRLDFVRPATAESVVREGPLAMGSFPLVPYSGRIRDGRFTFAGRQVALPPNFPPARHSIHGHGWQAPWSVDEATGGRAVLDYRHEAGDWPYPYRARQIVTLAPDRLTMRIELTNDGQQAMPAGIGHHPYFPRTPAARVTAAIGRVWLADDEVMPTTLVEPPPDRRLGDGVAVDRVALDNVFTGWSGRAAIDWPERRARLAIAAGPPLGFLVVYTPPGRDFFCVEPVSHCPDAVNAAPRGVPDVGLVALAPGETLAGEMVLAPEWESAR
jgi:aldose 1-epimerase